MGFSRFGAIPRAWLRETPGEPRWSWWERRLEYGELLPIPATVPGEPAVVQGTWTKPPDVPHRVTFAAARRFLGSDRWSIVHRRGDRGLSVLLPEPECGAYVLVELEHCVAASGELEPWSMTVASHLGGYVERHPHAHAGIQIVLWTNPPPYPLTLRSRRLRRTALFKDFVHYYSPRIRTALVESTLDLSGYALCDTRPRTNGLKGFEWLFRTYLASESTGTTTPEVAEYAADLATIPPLPWPAPEPVDAFVLARLLATPSFSNLFHLRTPSRDGYCLGSALAFKCLKAGLTHAETVQILTAWMQRHDLDCSEWDETYARYLLFTAEERLKVEAPVVKT